VQSTIQPLLELPSPTSNHGRLSIREIPARHERLHRLLAAQAVSGEWALVGSIAVVPRIALGKSQISAVSRRREIGPERDDQIIENVR